jgi:oligo-1,6-glucosidase
VDNPYRDYYIWRPGKDGREPNNWASYFSPSAWQFDETTGEYYLHLFSRKQPDLNWENPKVRGEVFELMRWWLDKGIDGFRMDVINLISKTPGLPDAPVRTQDRYQWGGECFTNGPRLFEFLQEMKEQVLAKYDLLTVGETPAVTPQDAVALTNEETGFLSMVFQFEHMDLDADLRPTPVSGATTWRLADLKRVMTRWQEGLADRGWNSLYLSNHDQPRSVSRFGDDGRYRVESAKMLATFLHLQQGTPYVYQGEEIGMTNVAFASIEDYRDIATRNMYREAVEAQGVDPGVALAIVHARSRDNARTPMQWDDGPEAGFTTGKPWIGVNPNHKTINVAQALADPDAILHYYRQLIRLRHENPIMVYGAYDLILDDHPQIYAFTRTLGDERLLVILNFSGEMPVFELPADISFKRKEPLISNYAVDAAETINRLSLRPYEARVYRLG